jgi:hypothetical protein
MANLISRFLRTFHAISPNTSIFIFFLPILLADTVRFVTSAPQPSLSYHQTDELLQFPLAFSSALGRIACASGRFLLSTCGRQ